MNKLASPEQEKIQAKVLKLLWAIGGSTAGFVAQPGQQLCNTDNEESAELFRLRSRVLGIPAAAAMDAEEIAAYPRGVDQTQRLRRLATTDPNALVEAQRLISDIWNSMPGGGQRYCSDSCGEIDDLWEAMSIGVLAMVLLTTVKQDRSEKSLYKAQEQAALNRVEAILDHYDETALSQQDASLLKAYIQAGDPTAPFPETSRPTTWQREPLDIFTGNYLLYKMAAKYAVMCTAPAVLFGLGDDPRLSCALRVLTGIEIEAALEGILLFLPENRDADALDPLIPHIPGGAVTLLRFMAKNFAQQYEAVAKKIVRRYSENADTALQYCSLDEYTNLCQLLPPAKNKDHDARMEQLRNHISAIYENSFTQGVQQTIVHDYLSRQGNFADSVNILKPIRNEYRYLSNLQSILNDYKKIAGWDEFACRCIVLSALTCMGYGTFTSFTSYTLPAEEKRNMDAFVNALIVGELPTRDCITVLTSLYDNWYQDNAEKLIEEAIQEHFITPAGLDALSNAAQNGSSAARILAIKGLDALSADHVCAEGARKALILCSADSSKQVQELLAERYIRHPDWEQDYLDMLSSKKTAVRSLAVRILAGIDTEKYRSTLEGALAVEKNAKVTDQITALLGVPVATGADGRTPEDLVSQLLKGGKKRKVQWLLDQPLPVVHRTDEAKTPASENQIAALFVAYADLGRIGRSDTATAIATDLDKKDLEALACEVWELWFKAGSQSKTKWVLPFVAVFGGATMTPKLIRAINDWPQNAQGAIACDAVTALSVSPDPAALVTVDSISRKFKFRQVKAAAATALENAAKELGITTEELADRIVPSLDFAPDGTRIFDYGPRKFVVRLTPSLELAVNTDAGKAVKTMPAPGKTDDAEKAAAAYETYKALKKQIKTTVTAQRARLELALSAQRCWDTDTWRKLFVENPIMHQFAISLIWGVYENGELKETFRYMEDGSFNTADEEEYSLPDGANIGLVHPIELNEDTLNTWKQQLEDYEITQSIQQLSRPVFRLPAEQAQAPSLETVAGRILSALSFSGKLQGMGWYRGSVLDGGFFHTFYREDPSVGIGVDLNFSRIGVGCEDEEITVFDAVFYDAGTVDRGSYCYDVPQKEHIILLGQVPARYYSEIVWQLERATASAAETAPDWRGKKN